MNQALKPMPLWMSLLFFGIPATIGLVGVYVVLPTLDRAGLSVLWSCTIAVSGMFPLLLLAALVAYRLERRTLLVADLGARFRIGRLGKRERLWTLGLLGVYLGGQLLLMPTARWLATVLPSAPGFRHRVRWPQRLRRGTAAWPGRSGLAAKRRSRRV